LSQWAFKSAVELSKALAAKQVSAVELAQDTIARIERHDGQINAICVRDFDRALAAAREADAARARGAAKALLGIPMTVKESFNLAGTPTTWGWSQFKGYKPNDDSACVQRVKAAGAVILGKTNVPVALGDWQSYNDIYGITKNPYDLGRTPGGSSGGSSAALAAGFGPLSLGSDIGGSLRVPAHHCGIYAHKPTLGLVPPRGHAPPMVPSVPLHLDLAVVGPMTRTAADLALLLDVIAGPDEIDAGVGYRLDLPAARHEKIGDFRILIIDSHPLLPSAASVRGAIDRLAEGLAGKGATISRTNAHLPDLAESARLYMRLLFSFLASSFPPHVYDQMQAERAKLPDAANSLVAERLRGCVSSHRAWVLDDGARQGLRAQWRALFKTVDAVICPVMPTPAYPLDFVEDQNLRHIDIDGAKYPYLDQLVWAGVATTPGLPATAIPAGQTPEGLPIGLQIIGPWLNDRTPLRLAELIEREFGGFTPPPQFAD